MPAKTGGMAIVVAGMARLLRRCNVAMFHKNAIYARSWYNFRKLVGLGFFCRNPTKWWGLENFFNWREHV